MQVIIYTTPQGNVAVTLPTGELPIEQVLVKDCPEGAIIVDDSVLPQGDDANYFEAWELINGQVVVNADKKAAIQTKQQAEQNAKDTAIAKLTAIGLTSSEIAALGIK
jgi:hypothetical protein